MLPFHLLDLTLVGADVEEDGKAEVGLMARLGIGLWLRVPPGLWLMARLTLGLGGITHGGCPTQHQVGLGPAANHV